MFSGTRKSTPFWLAANPGRMPELAPADLPAGSGRGYLKKIGGTLTGTSVNEATKIATVTSVSTILAAPSG